MASPLPLMLAGPVLRHLSNAHFSCWFATSVAVSCRLRLIPSELSEQEGERQVEVADYLSSYQAADHLWIHQLNLPLDEPLPDGWVSYDLGFLPAGELQWLNFSDWGDTSLCYGRHTRPGFFLSSRISRLFHGSCRKPHYDSCDGLVVADQFLASSPAEKWPQLLALTGDQIYCDDVAAPMLRAIHQVIERLGFANETLPECRVGDSNALHQQSPHYYRRSELLPLTLSGQAVAETLFRGVKKPIFTSDNANNHLMSLAEVLTMYLMVWSPVLWQEQSTELNDELKQQLSPAELALYQEQQSLIADFAKGLPQVRRLLAHLPCAMIFDDHDVTDDWNLSAAWEQTAYANPLSKRIIGNALLGYELCQGQGNVLTMASEPVQQAIQQALYATGEQAHDDVIESLFERVDWGYNWPVQPKLVVLDTRTQRWRSERSFAKPSGLMDYEAIQRLQQSIEGEEALLLISPAPVFGVKLIEAIQHLFTFFGKPLMVDAESWMAHPGAIRALFQVFENPKTPKRFVILSGDVHYSFVFGAQLKQTPHSPDIWQITSSGIKNEFPHRLLSWLDALNRWLYSPKSPLNWLTKRRNVRVTPYWPEQVKAGRCLLNASGIGLVELDERGAPQSIFQLCGDGKLREFVVKKRET